MFGDGELGRPSRKLDEEVVPVGGVQVNDLIVVDVLREFERALSLARERLRCDAGLTVRVPPKRPAVGLRTVHVRRGVR